MNYSHRALLLTGDDATAALICDLLETLPAAPWIIERMYDAAQISARLQPLHPAPAGPPVHAVVLCAYDDGLPYLSLLHHLARYDPSLPVLVIARGCSDAFAASVFRSGAHVEYLTTRQLQQQPGDLAALLARLETTSIVGVCLVQTPDTAGQTRCAHLGAQLRRAKAQIEELEQIVWGINTSAIDTLLLRDSQGNIVPFVREGADVLYRLQLEALNAGVLLTDEVGTILALNPTAARWLDHDQAALLGQPLFGCGLNLRECRPASTNGDISTPTYQLPLPGSGPHRTGQLAGLGPLRLPDSEAHFWLLTDITDELHLRQRDQFLATLLTQVQEGVIVCKLDGVVTYWNEQAELLLGWPGQTLIGETLPAPQTLHGHRSAPLQLLHRALGQVRRSNVFRSEWQRQDPASALESEHEARTPLWLELRASPLRDDYGQIDGMLVIVRDISERKLIEMNIQSLYQQTRAAYTRLQVATEEMIRAERLRVLGQMASGVAHDFNNILTPILGYAELALATENLPREVREDLNKIATAARDASNIVTRLRYFYRPHKNSDPHQSVDLHTIVRQCIDLTRPRWRDIPQAQGVEIAVVPELEPTPLLLGDATELRELLINLIFNAVDAMPKGGTIRIGVRPQANAVALTVSDTGTGISESVRSHLFEPFFTTKGEQGSGLGLSICQGIADHHNATIDIASMPGSGTTVTVFFPPSTVIAPASPELAPDKTSTLNILYIDDDPDVRAVVTRMLESLGQYVESASSGQQALNLLHILRFDVMISDLGMPGMSGAEIIAAAREIDPAMTTVLLTGWGQFLDQQQNIGADYLLSKPVRLDDLRHMLAAAFQHGRALNRSRLFDTLLPRR